MILSPLLPAIFVTICQSLQVLIPFIGIKHFGNHMTKKNVHEVLKNLHWLIGKWKTIKSHAEYPTMKYKFEFEEDLEFWSLGQPLLNYKQVTRNPKNKMPMHLEYGFLRPDEDMCTVAFLTAQNLGLATLEEGTVKEGEMVVQTACIGCMKFAKQTLLDIRRTYKLNSKGELEYVCLMETPQTPLAKHIESVYKRENDC